MGQEDVDTTIKVGQKGACGDETVPGREGTKVSVRKYSFAGLGGTGYRKQGASLLLPTTACQSTIIPKQKVQFKSLSSAQQAVMCNLVSQPVPSLGVCLAINQYFFFF